MQLVNQSISNKHLDFSLTFDHQTFKAVRFFKSVQSI